MGIRMTERLSWSDYVTKYEEASDLENDLQTDVANLESGNAQKALPAWEDISQEVYKNPIWKDLLMGANGNMIKTYISNIAGAAQTYMSNEVLSIQQPNCPGGTIPLYAVTGNPTWDDGSAENNYADTDEDGDPIQANFFEMISGQYTELANMKSDAQFFSRDFNQWQQHMGGVNWANGGLNYDLTADDSGDGTGWCTAFGSLQQWAPFIILTGGDDSALNAALLQV